MAQFTLSDFVGLVTAPGLLARNQSSLVEADNVVIDTPGLIRQRRGFKRETTNKAGFVFSHAYTNEDFVYSRGTYVGTPFPYGVTHYTNKAGDLVFYAGAPALNSATDYGQGIGRIRAFSQNGMLYCNSPVASFGTELRPQKPIIRLDSPTSTQARYAGAPIGMAPDTYNMSAAVYSVLYAGTFNFLLPNCAVAYRVTWHRKLGANRAELNGAPAGRVVIRNISGTSGWVAATAAAVQIRIPVPKELFCTSNLVAAEEWFCRVWRSPSTSSATEEPVDAMNLVSEIKLTATDITNGYCFYQDNTPDTYLSLAPALYTNPKAADVSSVNISQGLDNANLPPPFAAHCVYWAGRAWYGNYCELPSNTLRFLAVGTGAIVDGNTIQIDGIGYRAKNVPGARVPGVSADFQLVTSLSSMELNIEATARNLVEVYNRNAALESKTSRAYYTSVSLSEPGQILFIGATFPAISCPYAAVQFDSGAALLWQKNYLRYSKAGEADHCSIVNSIAVGPSEAEIIALKPLRDRLYVFTTKGIYVVTGNDPSNFQVYEFDLTFKLLNSAFIVECDDNLIGWFREGIAEITEGGVQIISGPIENIISPAGTSRIGLRLIKEVGFAVSYRMRHQVLFFYAKGDQAKEAHCAQWLVWDTRTRAWTTGSFDPNKEYTGASGSITGFKWKEGKSFAAVPVNPESEDLIVAWGANSTGNSYMFTEKQNTVNDSQDVNADNTTYDPQAKVTFQFSAPGTSDGFHWQQTLVHMPSDQLILSDALSLDDYVAPSSFTVSHRAAGLSGAIEGVVQPVTVFSNAMVRVEPPADARRGQKMQVKLRWIPLGNFGIVGITQVFRPGTANPKAAP